MTWNLYEATVTQYNIKENGKNEIIVRGNDSDVDKLAKPPTPVASSLNGGMFISNPDIGQKCLVAENPKSSMEVQIITYLFPSQFTPQGDLSSKEVPIGGTLLKTGGMYSSELYLDRNGIGSIFCGPEAYLRINGKANTVTLKTQEYSKISAGSVETMNVEDNTTFHRSEFYKDQRFNDPFRGYEERLIEERGENSDEDGFIFRQTVKQSSTFNSMEEDIVLRKSLGVSDDKELQKDYFELPDFEYGNTVTYKHRGINTYFKSEGNTFSNEIYLTPPNNYYYKKEFNHSQYKQQEGFYTDGQYIKKYISNSIINETTIEYDSGLYNRYFDISGSYISTAFSGPSYTTEFYDGGRGFKFDMDNSRIVISSMNNNISVYISDNELSFDVGASTLTITPSGLTFNGRALVFEDLVDFINNNKSNFGIGNMGSPVPLSPPALGDFAFGFSGTPQNSGFKTN